MSKYNIFENSISSNNHYALPQDRDIIAPPPNRNNEKPPPIVTVGLALTDIAFVMFQCAIPVHKYDTQYVPDGIKVHLTSIENFKVVVANLIANNVQHYTHDIRSEKADKYVLNGLLGMSPAGIRLELCKQKINCLEVKMIKHQSASYIVYTTPNSIDLSTLQASIKSINNVLVHWESGRYGPTIPTQCNNCQLYGHGEKNCYLKPKCVQCGAQHRRIQCLLTAYKPKCCLCSGEHPANSVGCPKRHEYLRMCTANAAGFVQRTSQSTPNTQPFTPEIFPKLPDSKQSLGLQPIQPLPLIADYRSMYFQPAPFLSYANITGMLRAAPAQLPNCAATPMERKILTLSTELALGLHSSTTRLEQLQAINNAAIKFVYKNV